VQADHFNQRRFFLYRAIHCLHLIGPGFFSRRHDTVQRRAAKVDADAIVDRNSSVNFIFQ
jgi:hypothetical protein